MSDSSPERKTASSFTASHNRLIAQSMAISTDDFDDASRGLIAVNTGDARKRAAFAERQAKAQSETARLFRLRPWLCAARR